VSRERDEKEMSTTLTKGLKGLLAVGLGAFMLALAPHAVADTTTTPTSMHSSGPLNPEHPQLQARTWPLF
jgi:hypothetical protein